MVKFGLIGINISHSVSPTIHKKLFEIFEIEADYQIYDLEENTKLDKMISMVRLGQLKGLNVTTPFKTEVIKYVDELTEVARLTNSVNTIYLKNDKVIGDNTDFVGLRYLIESSGEAIKNKKVYILGTGGASLTAFHVVKRIGSNPVLVSRTPKTIEINDETITAISYNEVDQDEGFIINGTPLGNINNLGLSSLSDNQVIRKIVFDLNYKPSVTKLMSQAMRGYNGLLMLVAQAVFANVKWFNLDFDDNRIVFLINKVMEAVDNE